jgi:NitT/TauT family transport system substrate-binding protein
LNRRSFVSACSAAGVGFTVRPAGAAVTVRIGTNASESTGAVFYAQDRGFFAAHGLAADIRIIQGGAAVGSAMIAGDLEVGNSDTVTMAVAHDHGLPFVLIAPGELHSIKAPTVAVVTRDANVRAGPDFNGKTIGCSSIRGFGYLVTDAWIDNNGGDSKTVKWIEMPFPALPAALERGTIDGLCAPEPFVTAAVAKGGHLIAMDQHPIAPVVLQSAWFGTKDWVAKNPATVAAFATAVREAGDWANKNVTAAEPILSKYSSVPLAVIAGSAMRGLYPARIDPVAVQPVIDGAAKYGMISRPFPARDFLVS